MSSGRVNQSGESGDGEASAELASEIEDLRERNEELQTTLDEREDRIADLREQVEDLEERTDDLQQRAEHAEAEAGDMEIGDAYTDFLDVEVVQEQIGKAKDESGASPRYVKGVVATVMDEGGPVSYDEIAGRLGVSSTSHVSEAATTLESMKVVEKDKRDGAMVVDLNTDGIREIRKAAARRDRTQDLMEGL